MQLSSREVMKAEANLCGKNEGGGRDSGDNWKVESLGFG